MIIEDSAFTPRYTRRPGGGFWSRLFKSRRPRQFHDEPFQPANPNPGGWVAKQTEREQAQAELDRILKKVSEQGIQSLSYVERQTLEHITRQRQREDREFQRDSRV